MRIFSLLVFHLIEKNTCQQEEKREAELTRKMTDVVIREVEDVEAKGVYVCTHTRA